MDINIISNLIALWVCVVVILVQVSTNNKKKENNNIGTKGPLKLTYEDLFRLLDVVIVSECNNYITINNLANKDSTILSTSLEDTRIELSNKIYTKCISDDVKSTLQLYVRDEFIKEYISRSVRNNILGGSYTFKK